MPEMDGMQATQIIRGKEQGQPIPIVALSAGTSPGDRDRVLGVGMTDYLTKPVGYKTLLATVERLLCFGMHSTFPSTDSLSLFESQSFKKPAPSKLVIEVVPSKKEYMILVVDDDLVCRKISQKMLQKAGYRVITAKNGKEAVSMFEEAAGHLDLVLMDVQMPEMDGCEATRTIRGMEYGEHIPIIALSAGAMLTDREQGVAAGMSYYLTKPVDYKKLLETVQMFIGTRNGARAA